MNSRKLLAALLITAFGCSVLAGSPAALAADKKKDEQKVREAPRPVAKPDQQTKAEPKSNTRSVSGSSTQRKDSNTRDNFIDRDGNGVDDRRPRKVVRPEASGNKERARRPATVKPRKTDPRKEPRRKAEPPR